MENAGLLLINGRINGDCPSNFTHISKLGNSVIDLVWSNLEAADIILDLTISQIFTLSDHFPCMLYLDLSTSTSVNRDVFSPSNLKWKDICKFNFHNYLQHLPSVAFLTDNLRDMYNNLTNSSFEAAKAVGMIRNLVIKNIVNLG